MQPKFEKIAKNVALALTLMLFVKVLGYFTLSENVGITRVLKVLMRVSMTGGVALLYFSLRRRGFLAYFKSQSSAPLVLYGMYLLLGLISVLPIKSLP